jgi:hypothetical protein
MIVIGKIKKNFYGLGICFRISGKAMEFLKGKIQTVTPLAFCICSSQ